MKILLSILSILFVPSLSNSQSIIGIESQAYPAGIVPGIRFDYALGNNSYITSRIGYNFTDRRNWGKHDNEEGGGPGFSLGYEYKGLFSENVNLHIRSDLWFLDINWNNQVDIEKACEGIPPGLCYPIFPRGKTKIIVLQPTVGLSYVTDLNNRFFLKPSLSFGYEINIQTKGEDVGEGAIILGGINLGYRF